MTILVYCLVNAVFHLKNKNWIRLIIYSILTISTIYLIFNKGLLDKEILFKKKLIDEMNVFSQILIQAYIAMYFYCAYCMWTVQNFRRDSGNFDFAITIALIIRFCIQLVLLFFSKMFLISIMAILEYILNPIITISRTYSTQHIKWYSHISFLIDFIKEEFDSTETLIPYMCIYITAVINIIVVMYSISSVL